METLAGEGILLKSNKQPDSETRGFIQVFWMWWSGASRCNADVLTSVRGNYYARAFYFRES